MLGSISPISSTVLRGGAALSLPENPDETRVQLRNELRSRSGADVAVLINDSHGRAFRNGTVGVAIGASGLPALLDLRDTPDLYQRRLQYTQVALADEIAAAASLLMGQANEGRPIILARGVPGPRGGRRSHASQGIGSFPLAAKTGIRRSPGHVLSDI
jgi:coenzyme F420-0:L-glutamate ligase / coenzyme F420-1:gamma-L-glutamate ligase